MGQSIKQETEEDRKTLAALRKQNRCLKEIIAAIDAEKPVASKPAVRIVKRQDARCIWSES